MKSSLPANFALRRSALHTASLRLLGEHTGTYIEAYTHACDTEYRSMDVYNVSGCLSSGFGYLPVAVPRSTGNPARLASTLFQVTGRQESRLASRVSNNDTPLLGRLHITLKVAADPVPHRDKGKFDIVKDVSVFSRQSNETLGEAVIVLLLLDCIVERRMTKVLFAVGNQKGFQL